MPRAAKAKRSKPVEEQTTPPEAQEPPKCASCGSLLDWRDRFYLGATSDRCKRCAQRNWHARLGVVAFHPAVVVTRQGEKLIETPVRFNRAARRGHGRLSAAGTLFDPKIAPRAHKRTRAERRAAARSKAAQAASATTAA